MPSEPAPRIWALLGPHRGDNNQVLALANALGMPFETKSLRYNWLRRLKPGLLGATFASVASESRPLLMARPPDLTISTGHRSVPVVQALRKLSGGRTRSVQIGYPRLAPECFDLVVTTPEYPVPDGPNVVRVPFALTPTRAETAISPADAALLEQYPAPRRLLLIGGPTLYWRLAPEDVLGALADLFDAARREGGSVLAVGSPRTPPELLHSVEQAIASAPAPAILVPMIGPPAYSSLLLLADSIFVTADSVAMVGDAVSTGKPVGLVPIRRTLAGAMYMGLMARLRPGRRVRPRDLRFFWAELDRKVLVGTVRRPISRAIPDLSAQIAERVRRLLVNSR